MTKKQKHPEKKGGTLILIGPMKFPMQALKTFAGESDVRLIFIDGGMKHAPKIKLKTPQLYKTAVSAGDGDSTKEKMKLLKTSQETSDLAFILSKMTGKHAPDKCLMLGFLGGRLDHQLFNLGEIALYLKKFFANNAPLIQLDDKLIFVGAGTHTTVISGLFSLAAFENNKIKISGAAKYKSSSWLELSPLSSRGVSNVGSGAIKLETKKPLAIIRS